MPLEEVSTNVMEQPGGAEAPVKPASMSVAELRGELRRRGEDHLGKQEALVIRLQNVLTAEPRAAKLDPNAFRVHCQLGRGSWESCVKLCFEELGFRQVSAKKRYDLLFLASWKGYELDIKRLAPNQYLNRFPGLAELAQKAALNDAIYAAEALSPGPAKYLPRSWVLPRDLAMLRDPTSGMLDGHTYIMKPDDGNQGDGIRIMQEVSQVEEAMAIEQAKTQRPAAATRRLQKTKVEMQDNGIFVLQEYVPRPLLLDGLKFDLRMYVLLAGLNPLRVYLCKQGMARFCTEAYQAPTASNIDNVFMHLTNYAINKNHDDFAYASAVNGGSEQKEQDQANEGTQFGNDGSKRHLASVMDALREEGRDVDQMWQDIQGLVVSTCKAMQPVLEAEYDKWHEHTCERHRKREDMKKRAFAFGAAAKQQAGMLGAEATDAVLQQQQQQQPQQKKKPQEKPARQGVLCGDGNSRCFHIIGVDVLLDEDLRPWLLEVNHSPSLNIDDSELDCEIKRHVLSDALRAAFKGYDPSTSCYEQLLP